MDESEPRADRGAISSGAKPDTITPRPAQGIYSCIIVGAGLAGLMAGRRLQAAGTQTIILEQELGAGGRLATVVLDDGEAIFDAGAQFFTVRDADFGRLVAEWQEQDLATEWSRGFATGDGSYYADGHPRYRGTRGMANIATHLAKELDVRFSARVMALRHWEAVWEVATQEGQSYLGRSLLLTPPAPQSLALLDSAGYPIPEIPRKALEAITFEPCIALLVQLTGASHVPIPGGLWSLGEPINWIADNHIKGISPGAGAVTLHAGPEFSQKYWDEPDDVIARLLLAAADPWLGEHVKACHIRRWRYSKPLRTHPEPFLAINTPAPLLLAGDAFAGPRVEGAAISGMAAAEQILMAIQESPSSRSKP